MNLEHDCQMWRDIRVECSFCVILFSLVNKAVTLRVDVAILSIINFDVNFIFFKSSKFSSRTRLKSLFARFVGTSTILYFCVHSNPKQLDSV